MQDRKLRKLYGVFLVIFLFLFIMITFPPIVKLFDRNDIWIGVFPLSQFYIFIVPFIAAVAMVVLYYFDVKYSKKEVGKDQGVNQNEW